MNTTRLLPFVVVTAAAALVASASACSHTRATQSAISFSLCEAFCEFRRNDGAIERVYVEAHDTTPERAWKRLDETCASITCRTCQKTSLLASVPGTTDLRAGDPAKDCKAAHWKEPLPLER